jgi:translation initiation factor IF-3
MEDKRDPAVDRAAIAYAEVRDQQKNLTKQEVNLKAKVAEVMHDHNLKAYKYGEIEVLLEPNEKVKVRIRGEEPEKE